MCEGGCRGVGGVVVRGLGFGVGGLGFGLWVRDLGFGIWVGNLGFRFGFRFRVWG